MAEIGERDIKALGSVDISGYCTRSNQVIAQVMSQGPWHHEDCDFPSLALREIIFKSC